MDSPSLSSASIPFEPSIIDFSSLAPVLEQALDIYDPTIAEVQNTALEFYRGYRSLNSNSTNFKLALFCRQQQQESPYQFFEDSACIELSALEKMLKNNTDSIATFLSGYARPAFLSFKTYPLGSTWKFEILIETLSTLIPE